jgi:hypothetical protein
MTDYIPLSGSTHGLINNPEEYENLFEMSDPSIFSDIESGQKPLPKTLDELTNEGTSSTHLSVDAALKLKIPISEVENKYSRSIYVQEYKKYKEITKNEQIVHVGIAIRWVINIEKLSSSANISTLQMIAASGQFNFVKASVDFYVKGISSEKVSSLIPTTTDLNTETYNKLSNALEDIRDELWKPDTIVIPDILGALGTMKSKDNNLLHDSAVIVYALTKISNGQSLRKALMKVSDENKIKLIKSIYSDITQSSDLHDTISKQSKIKAKELLKIA